MILFENIFLGLQSLKSNPLRSILTLVGIAVGIAAVLYVVVLGEITKRRISERLEAMGSNVLMVRPEHGHRFGVRTAESVANLSWDDSRQISEASEVITSTVPIYSGSAPLEYQDKNSNARINGSTPNNMAINNLQLAEGRFYTEADVAERSRVCVLGSTVQQDLFGDESPIGKSIFIKQKQFEVIGYLLPKGEGWSSPDGEVAVPITTAQERLFGVDYLSTILVQLRDAKDYDEALFDIEHTLRRNHRLQPDADNDFEVRRQDFFLSTIQETNTELANFIIIIALISLVVGGIGIANVMLVSVTERIREIGIRRAVGASRPVIIMQFIIEAMVLGMTGGLLGIIGGMVFTKLIIGAELILPWVWIFYSIGICSGIGVFAGMYPAFRAAQINVIEALRYE